MRLEEAQVQDVATTLFGFAGHVIHPCRQITLLLTLGDEPRRRTSMAPFLVVGVPSAYNIILGRLFFSAFMVVFPIGHLMGEVREDQKATQGCYVEIIKEDQKKARTKDKVVKTPTIFEVHVLEEVALTRSTLEEGELVEIV